MTVTDPALSPEFLALQQAVRGRYSLVRELGRGGMGIVFLARDLALERLVAIKLLPPAMAGQGDARERFLREARTAAALSHPHIVPIHLVEAQGAAVFFVMTYVEGETLGERIRRSGALSGADAMRIIQEVAWALGHAHASGIVHRDVKPDNILIERETGRALVTDFGIAHALGHETPADGVVRGTPQYVSPEVARGEAGDTRSDLYSLGITAWIAAAGRHPFEAGSSAALVLAHAQTPPPSLADHARVPTRFALAVDRCLRKDPAERWPSADAFASELEGARSRMLRVAAPVRAFLREWEGVGTEVTTAGTASLVAFTEALAMQLIEMRGPAGIMSLDVSILKWIFLLIGVMTAGLAKARLVQLLGHARAMLRSGFGHGRLARAQLVDSIEREDERHAVANVSQRNGRDAAFLLAGLAVGTAGAFALALSDLGGLANITGAAGAVLLPTLASRTLWQLTTRGSAEPLSSRILRGRFGRWFFRLAGIGTGETPAAAALEGPEPTEIALGQAARALLESLPREVRSGIDPGLPRMIEALESRAIRLRDKQEDAQAAQEFTAAVGALETLRLDLLRLSVGAITPAELTAELSHVREIGLAIDRQLEANAEVAALLEPEHTPTA